MQMAMSGVRDMSLIMTPPPGRLPVKVTVGEHDPDVVAAAIRLEMGIDNPHTNTLVIEDSQRLGLAQLYQLKGRVGRGRTQA